MCARTPLIFWHSVLGALSKSPRRLWRTSKFSDGSVPDDKSRNWLLNDNCVSRGVEFPAWIRYHLWVYEEYSSKIRGEALLQPWSVSIGVGGMWPPFMIFVDCKFRANLHHIKALKLSESCNFWGNYANFGVTKLNRCWIPLKFHLPNLQGSFFLCLHWNFRRGGPSKKQRHVANFPKLREHLEKCAPLIFEEVRALPMVSYMCACM